MRQAKKTVFGGIVLAMILSMSSAPDVAAGKDQTSKHPGAREGVVALLTMQSDAWNQGDLHKFLTGYLDSDEISFVSAGTELRGNKALRERYEKRYGKSRDTMGKLSFSGLEVTDLGRNNAMCIGHFLVERQKQPPLTGMFTLILTRTKSGWRIIHDHTSVPESSKN